MKFFYSKTALVLYVPVAAMLKWAKIMKRRNLHFRKPLLFLVCSIYTGSIKILDTHWTRTRTHEGFTRTQFEGFTRTQLKENTLTQLKGLTRTHEGFTRAQLERFTRTP